jgi:hypothetical protein
MATLRATEIFNDARQMLIAIESVDFRYSKKNSSCRLYGSIDPIAVIVCGPHGIFALDMDAKLIVLDQLREELPELDAIIAPFNKA